MPVIRLGPRASGALPAGLLVFASLAASAPAAAQSEPESHAKVSLIAEEVSISSGQTLWVGVLFQLDPGWHIYWQNPGDSGEPPKIRWELPPGYQAGGIRWPLPIRLSHGSVVDYAYEQQVLLMAPIMSETRSKSAVPVTLGAGVRYVVCSEICIPGKARLTLSIPDSQRQQAQYRKLFEDTRARLPRRAPFAWKVSVQSNQNQLVLTIEGAKLPKEAVFFPLDPGVIENAAPQTIGASQGGFRLALRKSDNAIKPVAALRGVVVLDQERGFEIAAPLGGQSP